MRRATLAGIVGLVLALPCPAGAQASRGFTVPDTVAGEPYHRVGDLRVQVYYAPKDSALAPRVLAFLEGQPPLPGIPDSLPSHVVAVLAHSPAALDALTGGNVPEWRAGVAIPAYDLLVVPTGEGRAVLDPEGRRVLRHEWAHLGLHQQIGGGGAPRWFDEGYAQYASGGWDAGEAWKLRILLALGRAPPLDSLTLAWPRDAASADAAYLLAASAVSYMLGDSGQRGLAVFLARWRSERSFDAALRQTFGVTTGQFEEDWRGYARSRYGWLFVLSHSVVFWMLMALLLLLVARRRQTRDREQMARLRAGEPPDEPAYWDIDDDGNGPHHDPPGIQPPP